MHVLVPKQVTNKIKGLVLKRVSILGIFGPNQSQGLKPSAAHLYPMLVRRILSSFSPGSNYHTHEYVCKGIPLICVYTGDLLCYVGFYYICDQIFLHYCDFYLNICDQLLHLCFQHTVSFFFICSAPCHLSVKHEVVFFTASTYF